MQTDGIKADKARVRLHELKVDKPAAARAGHTHMADVGQQSAASVQHGRHDAQQYMPAPLDRNGRFGRGKTCAVAAAAARATTPEGAAAAVDKVIAAPKARTATAPALATAQTQATRRTVRRAPANDN